MFAWLAHIATAVGTHIREEASPVELMTLPTVIAAVVWVLAAAIRRWLEPPVMTTAKWRALRILRAASTSMSACEIADMSCGELNWFMLGRQLAQLEEFGLVWRWRQSCNGGPMHDAYTLSFAGRAVLDGVVQLDARGVMYFQETPSELKTTQPCE